MKNFKLISISIVALGIVVIVVFFTVACMLAPKNLDESLRPDAASQFFDNKGEVIYTTASEEKRLPITFDKIPKHLQKAFIAVEDNRFYEHGGIDYRGTIRALWSNLRGDEVQGGSTITQQLAKNAFLTQERTITRKVKEAILAKQLENQYTKDEILDIYLNRIYFGQGAYGVESAALYYFGKHAQNLDVAESAALAAIPKSPNYYNPIENKAANKERQELVLDQMMKYGYLTAAEGAQAKKEALKIVIPKKDEKKNDSRSYFFDYVSQHIIDEFGADALYKGGLKVYTTLDSKMQKQAEDALEYLPDHYVDKAKLTQPQASLVAVDPQTGYIKAMIGGRGQDKFNRAALAVRQPGSAFKPFVYLTAMDNGMTAATVVEDKDTTFANGWNPQNYEHNYSGKVSLRTALKRSLNIPAVLVAQKVGPAKIVQMAKALGITTLVESGEYTDENLAMALGGLSKGVSPLEMAAAYGTIGNNGVYNAPVAITKIVSQDGKVLYEHKPASKQVVSAKAAYQTTDMLKDVLISGTGASGGIGRAAAGKTGTTDTYKDAWFVGYTPNLSCAVWVGDDNNESMGVMTGSMAPLSIWHAFMVPATRLLPAEDFTRPAGAETPGEPGVDNSTKTTDKKDKDKNAKDKNATKGQLTTPPKVKRPEDVKPKTEQEQPKGLARPPVISNKPSSNQD